MLARDYILCMLCHVKVSIFLASIIPFVETGLVDAVRASTGELVPLDYKSPDLS